MATAFEPFLWWTWLALAGFCGGRGTATLLLRRPARARLLHNGYRRARRQADGAFLRDNPAPMPALVEDVAQFTDHKGVERRATLRRLPVPHDDDLLVWYSPRNPRKASALGPHYWYGLMAAATATYLFLRFG